MKIKIGISAVLIIFSSIFYLRSCNTTSEYREAMEPAIKAKNNDPNKHPIFDGFPEPDLPDSYENHKTLLGIDTDKNGIRDDVDIWINRTGKNYNERMALRQIARAMTRTLILSSTKKNVDDMPSYDEVPGNREKQIAEIVAMEKLKADVVQSISETMEAKSCYLSVENAIDENQNIHNNPVSKIYKIVNYSTPKRAKALAFSESFSFGTNNKGAVCLFIKQ